MDARREAGGRRPLLVGSAVCVALGIGCSVNTLGALFGPGELADGAGELASRGRWILFGAAAFLCCLAFSPLARRRRASVSLATGLLILLGFEALAAPFMGLDTTLFLRDPELGWRLRPGGDDDWLGARIRINSLGMRGPLPANDASQRVLFLGDSVVFGAFIARDAQTLSARVQARLRAEGLSAQCLNAGVGGWAPWQERIWYERAGAELGAEVVLVHLVLNDVTEPLTLTFAGGPDEGFQLDHTREPGLFESTVWATAVRRWRRSARGDDPRAMAARAEALGVYELLSSPSLPASRAAWSRHLQELAALVLAIQGEGATPVVVAHPYTVQFEVPDLWWPQDSISAWCDARSVHFVDAGRFLAEERSDPVSLYHDGVHPNAEGAALIAKLLAEFLLREGLVH